MTGYLFVFCVFWNEDKIFMFALAWYLDYCKSWSILYIKPKVLVTSNQTWCETGFVMSKYFRISLNFQAKATVKFMRVLHVKSLVESLVKSLVVYTRHILLSQFQVVEDCFNNRQHSWVHTRGFIRQICMNSSKTRLDRMTTSLFLVCVIELSVIPYFVTKLSGKKNISWQVKYPL